MTKVTKTVTIRLNMEHFRWLEEIAQGQGRLPTSTAQDLLHQAVRKTYDKLLSGEVTRKETVGERLDSLSQQVAALARRVDTLETVGRRSHRSERQ